MKKRGFFTMTCTVVLFCVTASVAAYPQTWTTLFSFDGTNGFAPSSLIQATDGNFYGTTSNGGTSSYCADGTGCGTVFKLTPAGTLTTLFNFCHATNCPDGIYPTTLVQGSDGNFYGTTPGGGTSEGGTIYKITPTGKFTKLYSFCHLKVCDAAQPEGALVEGADGNFYGTTFTGGTGLGGTIYKITPTGTLTFLYNFCSQANCADGDSPEGGVLQASNGNFYGTTTEGGSNGAGTVFEITPSGKFSTVYNFESEFGGGPGPLELIQGANGNLYGTTDYGGASNWGSVFEVTLGGKYKLLHSFCSEPNCTDGAQPRTGLVEGSDGNLYGVTSNGGPVVAGTVFEITSAGAFSTLHDFCSQTNCDDGADGWALFQGTDGAFHGVASGGGGSSNCIFKLFTGCGVVFNLSTGLGPFVQPIPSFGPVGRVVRILGNNLTSTSSVTFNGTTAKFKVISDTYLEAQVPAGATSGTIEVVTPSSTLSSNVAFQVVP